MIKIGLYSDVFDYLPFEEMVDAAADVGIEALEIGTGNWSLTKHMDIDDLLANPESRKKYMKKITDRGLVLDALNCSGNQLAPNEEGEAHQKGVEKTFQLAGEWGIKKIVMMSGLPGGAPGEKCPNWVTHYWPLSYYHMLKYQWEDVLIPYWIKTVEKAKSYGIEKIALENHGVQCVYNVDTLMRLRSAVDPMIGMNLDPSHLTWMGGQPLDALLYLCQQGALYHCHIKDLRKERGNYNINGGLEIHALEDWKNRAWNCTVTGDGYSLEWWKEWFAILNRFDYDGAAVMELEDKSMDPYTTVVKSYNFVKQLVPRVVK